MRSNTLLSRLWLESLDVQPTGMSRPWHSCERSNVSKVYKVYIQWQLFVVFGCPGAQAAWPRLKAHMAHMLKWNEMKWRCWNMLKRLKMNRFILGIRVSRQFGWSCSQPVIANTKEGIRRLSIANTTAPRLWKGQRFPQRKGCILPLSYWIPPGHQSQAGWARVCPVAIHLAVQL